MVSITPICLVRVEGVKVCVQQTMFNIWPTGSREKWILAIWKKPMCPFPYLYILTSSILHTSKQTTSNLFKKQLYTAYETFINVTDKHLMTSPWMLSGFRDKSIHKNLFDLKIKVIYKTMFFYHKKNNMTPYISLFSLFHITDLIWVHLTLLYMYYTATDAINTSMPRNSVKEKHIIYLKMKKFPDLCWYLNPY